MFEHKDAHKCTWYQRTIGRRSMIDFVIVSSYLRPCVLDTQVKRGAELSTDHHLVVSWVWWQGKSLDRPPTVRGSLLRAIQSLYSQSESCVSVHGSKLDQVGAGLRQGCALSLILFVIYMDRISRRSRGVEGLQVLT